MEPSKIQLSAAELELAGNAAFILTKNSIIQKTCALFSTLREEMLGDTKSIAADIFSVSPKISKGENYLGLPYVVLDYPRFAREDDLCFIRTMFWWGNFFSSTLQLGGSFRNAFLQNIAGAHQLLVANQYYVGVHPDPWQHHFEPVNYRSLDDVDGEALHSLLRQQKHIKIAAKWPLIEWDFAAERLFRSWRLLTGLIAEPVK